MPRSQGWLSTLRVAGEAFALLHNIVKTRAIQIQDMNVSVLSATGLTREEEFRFVVIDSFVSPWVTVVRT